MGFDEELENLVSALWDLVKKGKEVLQFQAEDILFEDKRDIFNECFCRMYKEIQDKYMINTEALDRHKVAAIMMISIIKAKPLSVKDSSENFMGNYVLAADAGFNYMLDDLNRILEANSMSPIQEYAFPNVLACDTYYYKVFYRNLYYTESQLLEYNPLELADKLFLIEYITLLEKKVNMAKLRKK